MDTFETFQATPVSEKVGMAVMEAARRLVGWEPYVSSAYSLEIGTTVVASVTENGTELSLGSGAGTLSAGEYYYDRSTGYLYVRTSNSASPDTKFITLVEKYFFSNVPVSAPHDFSTGFEVEFLPYLDEGSNFSVEIENSKSLLGVAVSNSSSIKLYNDYDFWASRYDKLSFESHRVTIYSWHRELPITEAKVLYKGTCTNKKYGVEHITFEVKDFLDELRSPVSVPFIGEYEGAVVPDNLKAARQRRIYGFVRGHVPTPIDQVTASGYPLTGTFTVSTGSTTVTGTGTLFLKELTPGDDLYIGSSTNKVKIDAVNSDTDLTLSEPFGDDNQTDEEAAVVPSHPKRYANRVFLVAHHALARPSYTLGAVIDASQFYLDSTEGLVEGDIIEVNGSQGEIRVLGDGFLKLVTTLDSTPSEGDTLYLASLSNVYLNATKLRLTEDFTYDEESAVITLTETCEFNRAIVENLPGTITVSNGSRTITGVDTQFRTKLKAGSWIKLASKDTYFEVLDVTDDENILVRTTPGAADAGTGAGVFKTPEVYSRETVLSCDALGKMDADGNFIRTAGAIAKDLLIDAGREDDLNLASFEAADELLPYRIGISLPEKMSDRKAPSLRDVLNRVCRSTFCSVVLNNDFELEMSVLEPSWSGTLSELDESDVLSFKVESDSSTIVRFARVTYDIKEYDGLSGGNLTRVVSHENNRYLSSTEKEFSIDTLLKDEEDAEVFASRWAFLLDFPTSDLSLETGLQGARFRVNDVVKISHEKLYERFGSTSSIRIGAVLSVTKTIGRVSLLISDFGNAFSRIARIADDSASDYEDAPEDQRAINGYITDENGLTSGIHGINLIW